MIGRLTSTDRNAITVVGIGLVIVVFVCINIVSNGLLSSARLDLTEDRIYTLSEGTKEVLAAIDEPITIRFYRTEQVDQLGPVYATHAKRVDNLLGEYVRLSDGKIRLERYDPQPYSPEEDLAVADGLDGIPFAADGSQVYFGLAGSNSTDDVQALPFLAPARANFLEYDLTRLVHDLANPEKKKVAVIGDLPLSGSQFNGFRPWAVMESMRQFFEVESLYGSEDRIDDDVEILLLAQPGSLDEKTLYAVDQFALRGGKVLAFVDPFVEALSGGRPPQPGEGNAIETLEPLLAAWGVEIPKDRFVGDRRAAETVQASHDGRNVIVDYLAWLGIPNTGFASDDVVTANLKQVNFRTAGAIRPRDGASTTIEPLIMTSGDAAELDVEKVRFAPDPVGLWEDFSPAGRPYTLAARVTGDFKSAFPDGPPAAIEDEELRGAHIARSTAPLNLILVADADVLADRSWVRRQSLLGQQIIVPVANNGDFAVNALDNLAGSRSLIALRGRGLTVRPFERLEAMAQDAEAKLRGKEQELLAKIEETEAKIRDLQQGDQDGEVILTAEQQETIDNFRAEMLDLRRELRDVQFGLRKDVETLESRLKMANMWSVPVLLGLFAIGLATARRMRAKHYQATARA